MQSLDTLDNGKPYQQAVEDIEMSIGVMRYYAGWCDKISGETIPIGKATTAFLSVLDIGSLVAFYLVSQKMFPIMG